MVEAINWRLVNHEKAQRALGVIWPDPETMKLLRAHGGEQHGPQVETVTIPMYLLQGFLDDYASTALAAALARVAELEGPLRTARADALEEAAKVAETMPHMQRFWVEGRALPDERLTTLADVAKAIRARAELRP